MILQLRFWPIEQQSCAELSGFRIETERCCVDSGAAEGLPSARFFLCEDYRDIPGPFDRVVSVGMFEHVGVDFYETYFRRCAELLTDDGVMMLSSDRPLEWARCHQSLDYEIHFPRRRHSIAFRSDASDRARRRTLPQATQIADVQINSL